MVAGQERIQVSSSCIDPVRFVMPLHSCLISEQLHGSSANLLDLRNRAVRGLSRTGWQNIKAAYNREDDAYTYMLQWLVQFSFCIQLASGALPEAAKTRIGRAYVELVCPPSFAIPRNPCFKRKQGQVMPCFPHLSNTTGFCLQKLSPQMPNRRSLMLTSRRAVDCRLLAEPRVFVNRTRCSLSSSTPFEDLLRNIDCVNTMRA
jgi:hypothetical protein